MLVPIQVTLVSAYTSHISKRNLPGSVHDNTPMKKKIYIVEEGSNPSTDYFVLPGFRTQSDSIQRCKWHQLPQASDLSGSTVIFVRYVPKNWLRLIDEVRPSLTELIYFMDDDLFDTRASQGLSWLYRLKLAHHATWKKNWLIRTQAKIWVSTTYLLEKYKDLKPTLINPHPIAVVDDICRVFYHGSASHNDEIDWLYPVIKEVLTQNENIVFEIIGGAEVNKKYRSLPRVNVIHPMKWPAYQTLLATQGRHIGLAPLADTVFNQSRSCTKFFDITRAGAAGIYASHGPYQNIVKDKKNGLLVDGNPEAWIHAILLLSKDASLRKNIIEQAQLTQKMLRDNAEYVIKS